jgi:hypothetical protein
VELKTLRLADDFTIRDALGTHPVMTSSWQDAPSTCGIGLAMALSQASPISETFLPTPSA